MRQGNFFFAFTLVVNSGSAQATTAQQLLSACRAVASAEVFDQGVRFPRSYETGLCWGTFETMQRATNVIDRSENSVFSVCAPEQSTLTQMAAIFVKFAENNPQRLHEEAFPVVIQSLQLAFPCKAKTP